MKSRITIDLDYDNQPVIKMDYQESEDVRDKMVKRFIETFGFESNLCDFIVHDNGKYTLRPFTSEEFKNKYKK